MTSTSERGLSGLPNIGHSYSALIDELSGCLFRHVKGFFTKYFEQSPWWAATEHTLGTVSLTVAKDLCMDLLNIDSQESLQAWLARCQSALHPEVDDTLHISSRQISALVGNLEANIYFVWTDYPILPILALRQTPECLARSAPTPRISTPTTSCNSVKVLFKCFGHSQLEYIYMRS